jgi:hypothetical protein
LGEAFLSHLNLHTYLNLSGSERRSEFARIYSSYPALFDPDVYREIKALEPAGSTEEATKHLIQGFLGRVILGARTALLRDRMTQVECEEQVEFGERLLTLREIKLLIKLEEDRYGREMLSRLIAIPVHKINRYKLEELYTWHHAASELGYRSYIEFAQDANPMDIEALRHTALELLAETEYVYGDVLKWLLQRKLGLTKARRHDLDYLTNSFEYRELFRKRSLKTTLERFFHEFGVPIAGGIECDTEARSLKVQTVPALPVNPPRYVVFAIYPLDSIEDYASYLHQYARALSFAFASDDDPFELRYLRDETGLEAIGSLFENLLLEPKWLSRYHRLETSRDVMLLLGFRQLLRARLLSANFLYSLSLHEDTDFPRREGLYKEVMERATLCEHDSSNYLLDEEPFFPSANRLLGFIISHSLAHSLRERYDEQWWRDYKGCQEIKSIWKAEGDAIESGPADPGEGYRHLLLFLESIFG